jgi:PAS domain S-box-containing protein
VILQHERVAFADSGVVAITGLSEAELQRLSPYELFSKLHPEDRDTVCRYLRRLASSPAAIVGDMECRVLRTDGSESWLDLSASPMEYKGDPAVQVAVLDVTERKAAQEQAQRCESMLGALKSTGRELATSSELVPTLNAVMRSAAAVVDADDVHMCIYSDEVGSPDSFFRLSSGHSEQASSPPPAFQQSGGTIAAVPLRGSGSVLGIMNVVFGQPRVLSDEEMSVLDLLAGQAGAAVFNANLLSRLKSTVADAERILAEQTGFLGDQLAEATEAERFATGRIEELEEALVEATATNGRLGRMRAELDHFTSSVAHHLRSPFRSLQGFSEALLEDYGDTLDDTGRLYAERIGAAVQRLDARIEGLLAISQLGSAEMRFRDVELDDIVDDVLARLDVQRYHPLAQVSVENPLPAVIADRHTLLTVVENLVSNALKFVPADVEPRVRIWGETVRVEEETEPGDEQLLDSPTLWARLWVKDNGMGIPEGQHERIFRVFERLHGMDGPEGAGVGLVLVKKGTELLGGKVGLVSEEGVGSRFWTMLPAASSIEAQAPDEGRGLE